MLNKLSTEKVLWYLIAVAGIPYVGLFFFINSNFYALGLLMAAVFLFDWIIVPLYLFSGELVAWKKMLTIGVNLLLATVFIKLTGGAESIFYFHFYLLPLMIACVYGGLWESIITSGLLVILVLVVFSWQEVYSFTYMIAQLFTQVLGGVMLGYIIKREREQRRKNETMARELQVAYEELNSSHQQLQAYADLMEEMNETMEQLVVTDDLTMLYNYRFFQEYLDRKLRQVDGQPFALIMLDIDHFKQVNDRWGHQTGNEVLARLADLLQDAVRDNDVVVRYGGEEFVILLPNADAEGAGAVAERIRQTVADTVFYRSGDKELRITVSQGISVYPTEADNRSDLISNADKAMYKAKELGRNRVVLYKDIKNEESRE